MAAPPPREVTRENEARAWRLRQRCWTEQRIADEIGVHVATISRMLDRVERRLAEDLKEHALPIKARQTAQLEHVAAEAMAAWEKSKENAELERVLTKEIEFPTEAPIGEEETVALKLPAVEVKTTKESKAQAGDPALLAQVRGAFSDIREIWGLDAPKKNEHSGPDGGPIEVKSVANAFDYRLAALLERDGSGDDPLGLDGRGEGGSLLPVGALGEAEPDSS